MATSLREWVEREVQPLRGQPSRRLTKDPLFRDPPRATYADTSFFFSPADGILVYQEFVEPDEPVVDVQGRAYSLQDALRDPGYDQPSAVVGIFMTSFDGHVNRIPFPGRLSWRLLDPIDTVSRPMLDVEKALLDELRIPLDGLDYLHVNQRMVNRVDSAELGHAYFILQLADDAVDSITPLHPGQNRHYTQGRRFSQIRYGSQVDLIVPLSPRFELTFTLPTGSHVEAGLDPVIRVSEPDPLARATGGIP